MSMRRINIRFDPEVLDFIEREAGHLGITTSEYIRAAAYARAAFSYVRRVPNGHLLWDELYEAAQRVTQDADTLDTPDELDPGA